MSNKDHAKEYLSEFSTNKPVWLQTLIKDAIETNGSISESRLNEIFDNLLNNSPIQAQANQISSVQQSSEKLLLESLTHVSGVNALCENQTIKFSPDVTVLYGLNGSGKSGYFRLLNNMAGGVYKEIRPNIYANVGERKSLNVSIKYKVGNSSNNCNWTDSHTKLPDFHGIKVFDTSYLNGLLQTKNPDETIIYPLGLHLFGYIAKILDSFTTKLNEQVETAKRYLPIIKTEELGEALKRKFINREYFSATEQKEIKEKFNFSDIEKNALNKNEEEYRQLLQTNYQDTIDLLVKHNKELSTFVTKVNAATENMKFYGEELGKKLEQYESAKKKNDEARQRSVVLMGLPKSNTQEWKSFVLAGQRYSSLLEKEKPEKCPYCQQELKSEEAISIVKAYADYLSDTSEKELKDAAQSLTDLQSKIEKYDVAIVLTDEIKNVITDYTELEKKIGLLAKYKDSIQSAKTADEIKTLTIDFSTELNVLSNKQKQNEATIKELSTTKEEKDKKVGELQKEIARLKEKKSISEQKVDVEKYFAVFEKSNTIEAKKTETRTNQLTTLANQAQKDLLTDALKTSFEKELKALGRHNLKVQLVVINGNKGKCNSQLVLTGNNSVTDILSEGEQKAVGLAMFFAEIQNENYPIILDDPVTSLDHDIAGMLAKRLLDFHNQVIVFCHNKLFLDGFETSKENHVCKNFDSCCNKKGKHIFIYKIYGDGKDKGVLSNYKSDDSDSIIKEVNYRLSKRPFEDSYGVSIMLRRAVEKIIDEEVFKYQLPPRVSNKNSRINWDELKNINSKPDLVDRLRIVHDTTSEEDHVGTASIENPISIDKLRELSAELAKIKEDFKS